MAGETDRPGFENMSFILQEYNPYSGGQGIYIYYLSKELINLGHEVHLLSGHPYPDVVEGVQVHKLESLGLYDTQASFPGRFIPPA